MAPNSIIGEQCFCVTPPSLQSYRFHIDEIAAFKKIRVIIISFALYFLKWSDYSFLSIYITFLILSLSFFLFSLVIIFDWILGNFVYQNLRFSFFSGTSEKIFVYHSRFSSISFNVFIQFIWMGDISVYFQYCIFIKSFPAWERSVIDTVK